MAIDEAGRRARRQWLGSSDAPALANRDPFGRTVTDVVMEKLGLVRDRVDRDRNNPKIVGQHLEAGILDWLEQTKFPGMLLQRNEHVVARNGFQAANLDGRVMAFSAAAASGMARRFPVGTITEAKTMGIFGEPAYAEDFGEELTDDVPDHTRIQVAHQFATLRDQDAIEVSDVALVPCLIVRRGFVVYRVRRSDALCDAITELEGRVWQDYVLTGEVPEEPPPSLETLSRRIREPGKSTVVGPELVARWLEARETARLADVALDDAKAAVIHALGDAEVGELPDGASITYREQTRGAYEVEEASFRVLRTKKAPKPKR